MNVNPTGYGPHGITPHKGKEKEDLTPEQQKIKNIKPTAHASTGKTKPAPRASKRNSAPNPVNKMLGGSSHEKAEAEDKWRLKDKKESEKPTEAGFMKRSQTPPTKRFQSNLESIGEE